MMESENNDHGNIKPLNIWRNLDDRMLVNVPISEHSTLEYGFYSTEKHTHTQSDQINPEALCFSSDILSATPKEPDDFVQPFFRPKKYSADENSTTVAYFNSWRKMVNREPEGQSHSSRSSNGNPGVNQLSTQRTIPLQVNTELELPIQSPSTQYQKQLKPMRTIPHVRREPRSPSQSLPPQHQKKLKTVRTLPHVKREPRSPSQSPPPQHQKKLKTMRTLPHVKKEPQSPSQSSLQHQKELKTVKTIPNVKRDPRSPSQSSTQHQNELETIEILPQIKKEPFSPNQHTMPSQKKPFLLNEQKPLSIQQYQPQQRYQQEPQHKSWRPYRQPPREYQPQSPQKQPYQRRSRFSPLRPGLQYLIRQQQPQIFPTFSPPLPHLAQLPPLPLPLPQQQPPLPHQLQSPFPPLTWHQKPPFPYQQ